MEVGKDVLGTRENMMFARSSLANSQHRSESASLGDAGDPFGTIIRGTSWWPCEYAVVKDRPETAAEVTLFGDS